MTERDLTASIEELAKADKARDYWGLNRLFEAFEPGQAPFDDKGQPVRETQFAHIYSSADLLDLVRLHFLVRARKARNILEFGSGLSSAILAHALEQNWSKFEAEGIVEKFPSSIDKELVSVDESAKFSANSFQGIRKALRASVVSVVSEVELGEFQGKDCTFYTLSPRRHFDFVYLDGPSQFAWPDSTVGNPPTRQFEVKPLAGDILRFENSFEPGAFLLVDGRTANARFLATNFSRNWYSTWWHELDVTVFELDEPPMSPSSAELANQLDRKSFTNRGLS